MQSKYSFKAINKKSPTYLHDLSCTLAINLKEMSNINNTNNMTNNQINILKNKISIISELFKNLRKIHKNKKNIKSKILLNNQLLQEIKRRYNESLLMLHGKKIELIKALEKKEVIVKKDVKKFKEVEIFIRRESLAYDKYRDLYKSFIIDPFISKNTLIKSKIKFRKDENKKILNLINIINYENDEYKKTILDNIKYNKKKIYINNKSNIDYLLIIQQDKIKYFQEYLKRFINLYRTIGIDKFIIQSQEKQDIIKHQFTNLILNNLNKLSIHDNNNSFAFQSELESANNNENENQDSSELWSASEIEDKI